MTAPASQHVLEQFWDDLYSSSEGNQNNWALIMHCANPLNNDSFLDFPWWPSGSDSTCPCRGHGFDPWCRKIQFRQTPLVRRVGTSKESVLCEPSTSGTIHCTLWLLVHISAHRLLAHIQEAFWPEEKTRPVGVAIHESELRRLLVQDEMKALLCAPCLTFALIFRYVLSLAGSST